MIKKIFAIVLVLALILNIFAYAANKIELLIFWLDLGVIALITYAFYSDKGKKVSKKKRL